MDRRTIDVYDREGANYAVRRGVQEADRVAAFARRTGDGLRLDLGCGPGHYLDLLGDPVVALDASRSMVEASRRSQPQVPAVQADLLDVPFGRQTFDAVWASKAHQHVRATDLPLALADVHRILKVGGVLELTVFQGVGHERTTEANDDLPDRYFAWWEPEQLREVIDAAGFDVERFDVIPNDDGYPRIQVTATAARRLPDHVGAGMRLLCCGLNPSLHAADAGVGYVSPSNRFWPAMQRAGLATRDRDPRHLLRVDGIGMTDLVKRATARADELEPSEYRDGMDRLERLCTWLEPDALLVVGLAGWRAAVDRKAVAGWQIERVGTTPVYVMPSTSGLNAHVNANDLVDHLTTAARGPSGA